MSGDPDPDTAAELRLAKKDARHDHDAGVRASRRRWRTRRRDSEDLKRHHGGSP